MFPGSPFYCLTSAIAAAVPISSGHEVCRTLPFPGPATGHPLFWPNPGPRPDSRASSPETLFPFTLLSGDAWLKPVLRGVHHKFHGGLHVPGGTWRQTEKGNPVGWTEGSWETCPLAPFNPPSPTPTPWHLQLPNEAKSNRRISGLGASRI